MGNVPKVWLRFSVTKNAATKKFKIVDLPLERSEELVDLMIKYFIRDEYTFKAAGVPESEEALIEYKNVMKTNLDDRSYHAVVCCIDKDDDSIGDIAGASIMALTTKTEPIENEPKSKAFKKLLEMLDIMESKYPMMEIHNLDKYYDDRGLFVHPDYRGNGIAQKLFNVRRLICKEHGVSMTGAWMTAYGSQIAAQRDGWIPVCEAKTENVAKEAVVTYEKSAPAINLFMITKAE